MMNDIVVVLASAAEGVVSVFGPFYGYSTEADEFLETLDLRGGRSAKIVELTHVDPEDPPT